MLNYNTCLVELVSLILLILMVLLLLIQQTDHSKIKLVPSTQIRDLVRSMLNYIYDLVELVFFCFSSYLSHWSLLSILEADTLN